MQTAKKRWIAPQVKLVDMERARAKIVQAIEILEASGEMPGQVKELRALIEMIDEDFSG